MILVFRLENNVAPNNVSNTLMIFINACAITDDQFNLFTIKMGQMDFDISNGHGCRLYSFELISIDTYAPPPFIGHNIFF